MWCKYGSIECSKDAIVLTYKVSISSAYLFILMMIIMMMCCVPTARYEFRSLDGHNEELHYLSVSLARATQSVSLNSTS